MEIKNVLDFLSQHPSGSFLDLVDFNDHRFGVCDITGASPVWEMHPDTDEFFYVIEGYLEMLFLGDEVEKHTVSAGSVLVIPKGIWHKPAAPEGAKFFHFTPGQSLHSEVEDPRQGSET